MSSPDIPFVLTEMATAAVLTPSDLSFENATETVKCWAQKEPTEDETLVFLKQAIRDLGKAVNVTIFREAMKELGIHAVKTDNNFAHIQNTMDAFINHHGNRFPGLIPFKKEWDGYRLVRWYSTFCLLLVMKPFLGME